MLPKKRRTTQQRGKKRKPVEEKIEVPFSKRVHPKSELKFLDISAGPTNITDSLTLVPITGMAQGMTNITRIGNVVQGRSIRVKYWIRQVAQIYTQWVRIMLVQDLNSDGNIPNATDILISDDLKSLTQMDFKNKHRFNIIKDKYYRLGDFNDAGGNDQMYDDIFYRMGRGTNIPEDEVHFDGTAANNYSWGNLWLLFIGEQPTTNYPTIEYETRFRYVDQ